MQRDHCRGSQVRSKWYRIGYSATLARAYVHSFIYSTNRGLPLRVYLYKEVI